jgi:hypothetical protein
LPWNFHCIWGFEIYKFIKILKRYEINEGSQKLNQLGRENIEG